MDGVFVAVVSANFDMCSIIGDFPSQVIKAFEADLLSAGPYSMAQWNPCSM